MLINAGALKQSKPAKSALANSRLIQEIHEKTLFPYYQCSVIPPNTQQNLLLQLNQFPVKGRDIAEGVDWRQLCHGSQRAHRENKICTANKDVALMIGIQVRKLRHLGHLREVVSLSKLIFHA